MPKFRVDTHLFRELGQLLVGRDSTALVELIKNSYDADATSVRVHGENLAKPESGSIVVKDNGNGMTQTDFEIGFLTIASRTKEASDRRSPRFKRRFTGEKGIGRLAAHKLARTLQIRSEKHPDLSPENAQSVEARIDWDAIEKHETFDDIENDSRALTVTTYSNSGTENGTWIRLTNLRRKWSDRDRERLYRELSSFKPPSMLVSLPENTFPDERLFAEPRVKDAAKDRPFEVVLTGDLAGGDDYWSEAAKNASWVLEIDAASSDTLAKYRISPSADTLKHLPNAKTRTYEVQKPQEEGSPLFYARILIKEGRKGGKEFSNWLTDTAGIRVYLEGFRVLPYGEPGDDWLWLDSDYKRRSRHLRFLSKDWIPGEEEEPEEGLSIRSNNAYLGAVFLTQSDLGNLEMLINREGFVPNPAFDAMRNIIRVGTDLSVRVSAAARREPRQKWRDQRDGSDGRMSLIRSKHEDIDSFRDHLRSAEEKAQRAAKDLQNNDAKSALEELRSATESFESGQRAYKAALPDPTTLRILSAIGTQMSAFVHEVRGLLGIVGSIENSLARLRDAVRDDKVRKRLAQLVRQTEDLRRSIERQATYLTDISSADSRRRRSRQPVRARVDSASNFYREYLANKNVTIAVEVSKDIKTRPMFPAEVTLIISNLLSNAAKAVEDRGHIRVYSEREDNGVALIVENTGVGVEIDDSERWFEPFESTSTDVDPALGQGMGMGLPIVRSMVDQYGGDASFVRPTEGYSTAVRIWLPEGG